MRMNILTGGWNDNYIWIGSGAISNILIGNGQGTLHKLYAYEQLNELAVGRKLIATWMEEINCRLSLEHRIRRERSFLFWCCIFSFHILSWRNINWWGNQLNLCSFFYFTKKKWEKWAAASTRTDSIFRFICCGMQHNHIIHIYMLWRIDCI